LERSKNAEEALSVFAQIVENYGYTGDNEGFAFGLTNYANADSYILSDPDTVWVVHIVPSDASGLNSVWVAQKLPEGHFTIVPNVFVIRDVDLNDSDNFR